MKYIITGGLGFVGNELVRQLLARGDQVTIIDNHNRVAPSVSDLAAAESVKVDITDADAVRQVFEKVRPDRVVHLAAIHYIPECNANPSRTLLVNVAGTQSILSACALVRVGRVILASSGAVYADSEKPLSEDMDVAPVDIYGVSKLMLEQLAQLFHAQTGIPTIAFRLFNVFGPRETNAHIIPEILQQLRNGDVLSLGNIDPRRDFIFTEDVAQGIIRFSEKTADGIEIVNLASGNHASMRELIELICRITGRNVTIHQDPSRFRKADKMVQVANLRRLRQSIGWTPQTTLEEGLTKLLRFEGFIS